MKFFKVIILFVIFIFLQYIPTYSDEIEIESYRFDFDNDKILQKRSKKLKGRLKQNKKYSAKKDKKLMFIGYGTLNFGQVSYYPYTPVKGDYNNYINAFGPNPPRTYNFSYGFGIGVDYKIYSFLSVFADGGTNSWNLLLAKKDEYAYGEWVAESTNFTSAVIGPFPMDTYYYMDTTVIRAGARYIVSQGFIQPWVGACIGMYAWQATIGNRKEGKQYGNDSGISIGYSFLGGGDLIFGDFILRLYLDYGSGVAYPKISGLLDAPYNSAVFKNTGGEHATGPYKFGLAFGVKY